MKIIKYSIIAALGVFLLPAPPPDEFTVMQGGTRINLETGEVLSAAASTFSDVSGFCQRQPGVCNTVGQVYSALEIRAKYNFKRLYEWSTSGDQPASDRQLPPLEIKIEKSAQISPEIADSIVTGSVGVTKTQTLAELIGQPAVNTLQIEDLVPEWRGPVQTSTG